MRELTKTVAAVLASWVGGHVAAGEAVAPVDFTRQIRPILSENCFVCHGPAEDSREAELRLDVREIAIEDRGDYAAIMPGDPEASALMSRITSDDESTVMPPPESKKNLTAGEIALLRRWIEQGAPYTKHWAFVAPQRPPLPTLSAEGQAWARTPVDHFVLVELERNTLAPSTEADKITLLRRLHLDLTGLPPTIEKIDKFAADDSPDAYEKLVDRLLASPHYGERWGRHWLDAARYADSDGYEKDLQRTVWPYRDWVIDAFNNDLPYDQFIVEQIAGDMLPDATTEQVIATGFLRNSMVNEEGGADPEQFRVEGLFDRIDAIGKSILSITTQCAQCHTHKFDPLTQADYYGMFAFLNSCEEAYEVAYSDEQAVTAKRIARSVTQIAAQLKRDNPDWRMQIGDWAKQQRGNQGEWVVLKPTELPYEGQKFRVLDDSSIISESYAQPRGSSKFGLKTDQTDITAMRLELLTHPQLPGDGPGRSIDGTGALSEFSVVIEPLDKSQGSQKVAFAGASADVNPTAQTLEWPYLNPKAEGGDKRRTGPVEFAIDGDAETAWTTDSGPATRHQSRKAVFVAKQPFGFAGGTKITIELNQSHGGSTGDTRQNYLMGRYRFSVTNDSDPTADPLPRRVRQLVESKTSNEWTDEEMDSAFSYWRTTVADWSEENERIDALLKEFPDGDFQLVVEQRAEPRRTHRLERGNFLDSAEPIKPHTPGFLHPFPADVPRDRLGFARWLVDRNSPTTARAIVNRIWQAYFGTGLVETPEDLGSQSPPPSHPKLLDWLAVELMDSEWSFKHLHRLIVGSATYRQSSRLTPQSAEVDPRNRMLARGPRVRVDAEIVRDIALAASGLLNDEIGGPSVYPPAPAFLFEPPASYMGKNWFTEEDQQRYRRSMYVHAYRSVPYPPLQAFDAPKGDAACVRRVRSNTPLQALTMLNETQFVECSRALAERVQRAAREDDHDGIRRAFRLCLTRQPVADELDLLQSLLDKSRTRYDNQPDDARAVLGLDVGGEDASDGAELAAWTVVCRAILNLDETITKQ